MRYEPLSRFPALHTRDVDELRQRLSGLFSVWSMDLGHGGQSTFEGRLNHRQLQDVGVTYARYGAALEVSLSHAGFYLQGFPVRGHGSFVVDGSEGDVSRDHGIVGGPGADMRIRYSSDFEHLIVRIGPQRLIRTLSGLLGRPVDPPLRMASSTGPVPEMAAAQRRLVEFVVGELDRTDAPLPTLVLAELEQALIVSYLNCNRHNYSHLLESAARPVAPWQVRLAEEYVEQNWDQPITVEALALVTGTSMRSLFCSFKKSRGMSPMTFVRQVRLQHAKEMLASARPETSVTSVACACGFSNMGHFAKYYYAAFGEQPSVTLKAARR
ncbi:AraC family transcriptional regulator [Bradyrhizobium lablabi]|uniref:AraC family transcriptional regulator n=1 Tax=Bradyrhizobium lablabi TaxID=722472 RepID=UPI001BAC0327|nr:AraC family transcriptional regulator [Bradyrhizobium lablabi]MBR0696150.1 AraC family transcriptional regulator [Bradyrhizobium lablabi]